MILHPAQSQIAKDEHRFRVVNCGRRFGKTTLAAEEMKGFAVAFDNARIPYYAPTRDDARDIMWRMIQNICQDIIVDKNESRMELIVRNRFGGQSQLLLYGWEAVQERRKGVGVKNNFIVLDEVAKYRGFWEGWHEVLRPTLTDLKGHSLFISTPQGFNHFYTLSQKENEDRDYKSFHFTSYDNPYLSKEELDKAKQELTENQFAQEYLADFRKIEGLVYNLEASEIIEAVDKNIKTEARIMGVDWGFRNPAAIVVLYLKDQVWTIVDEWKQSERTTPEISQVIQNKISEHSVRRVYPDPAEPDRIEECRRAGIPVYEANKDVVSGISHIQNLLKEKRLKVCRNCIQTIEEFNTYQYPEGKDGKPNKEEPEKYNDHLMDSMRYALYSYKQTPRVFNKASPIGATYEY